MSPGHDERYKSEPDVFLSSAFLRFMDVRESMIMNRMWPRAVTAEIKLMPWRAPVAWTMGVSPFAPKYAPRDGRRRCEKKLVEVQQAVGRYI